MHPNIFVSVNSLRASGFNGFVSVHNLSECKLRCVPGNRGDIGVYLVLRVQKDVPVFLKKRTGVFFKRPYPIKRLEERWVQGTPVVYIGKAGAPGKPATLHSRLRQYLAFDDGKKTSHWGGRLIWQLAHSEDLLICWKRTPGQVPFDIEKKMIEDFEKAFGKLPFANLKH